MSNHLWGLHNILFGPVVRPRLQLETLEIPEGVTAVLGRSGAGKTSLLNLLVEFEKAEAGKVVRIRIANAVSLQLSWVPPDFGLWSHLTVEEHLQAVAATDDGIVNQLIEQFDLQEICTQKPSTLSMGERARVAVARSLATKASVHVMDEPFAHVDPGRLDRYWQAVRQHLKATNASLIFSSHSPSVVMREAQHVVCLDKGKVIWTGTPQELYSKPPNRSLAVLLGPVNWIDGADGPRWIDSLSTPKSLRPEQLIIEQDDQSQFVVEQSWCVGPHQETEIKSTVGESTRTFYHRPLIHPFAKGTSVALRAVTSCLLLVTLLMLNGCRESSGDEPVLRVSQPHQYLLPAEGAMLPAARGMIYGPNGDLLILDNVGRVLVYDSAGKMTRKWWMPEHDVGRPEGICVLRDGRIAVADTHYNRIVIFDQQGQVLSMFGEKGHGAGQFIYSSAVTQDDKGFIYVAEYGGNDRIQKFTEAGEYVLTFGAVGTENGEFQRPSGIVWHEDVIYVADAINNRIQAFAPDGKFLRVVADVQATSLYYPYDISVGPDGSLYVPEYGAGRISRISIDGELLGRYGQEGRGEGEFWTPWGIAVSRSGKIAVADTGNRRVVELQL